MKIIKNNRGGSMLQVVVAFALLMILVASFNGIVQVATSFMMRAQQITEDTRACMKDYYENRSIDGHIEGDAGGEKTLNFDKFQIRTGEYVHTFGSGDSQKTIYYYTVLK